MPITRLANWLSRTSRQRRARLFQETLQPQASDRILDLGGGTGDHFAALFPFRENVTIADLSAEDLARAAQVHGFATRQIDGSGPLPFADAAFDIVFCSSVLEHVTGPKAQILDMDDGAAFAAAARHHQAQFAREIRRIGRGYFVQTPYRYFPVESHTWLPMPIVILPRRLQKKVMALFGRFWPKRSEADWHLLVGREMAGLFPDAAIHREWRFGFVKSLIAVRRPADRLISADRHGAAGPAGPSAAGADRDRPG